MPPVDQGLVGRSRAAAAVSPQPGPEDFGLDPRHAGIPSFLGRSPVIGALRASGSAIGWCDRAATERSTHLLNIPGLVTFDNVVERSSVALDLTYAALADPTRRAILLRLRQAEARVTDIARPFPISLAAVSRHIGVLENAGLVRREVRGRDHYLHAEPERLAEAERWIAEYTAFWNRRADALVAHLQARQADREEHR